MGRKQDILLCDILQSSRGSKEKAWWENILFHGFDSGFSLVRITLLQEAEKAMIHLSQVVAEDPVSYECICIKYKGKCVRPFGTNAESVWCHS